MQYFRDHSLFFPREGRGVEDFWGSTWFSRRMEGVSVVANNRVKIGDYRKLTVN